MKYVGIFDLRPIDGRKSFYGKAKVLKRNGCIYLMSYDTVVCCIDENGCFNRIWHGYSATTMRHVNAFRVFYGLPTISKLEWMNL